MAAMERNVHLARSLPPQLLHFFKRFPPPQLASTNQSSVTQAQLDNVQTAGTTSSMDPNANTTSSSSIDPPSTSLTSTTPSWKHNPFLPFKNPSTGAWHGPHYSLRRQADLFKLAATHSVLPLMPLSPKHPEVKASKRIEHGLRVKGTGVGQKVKGKYWERTLRTRLETRRRAMEAMPDMINLWKERGHGRGWKKFPKGKSEGLDGVFKPDMRHAWVHERAPSGV